MTKINTLTPPEGESPELGPDLEKFLGIGDTPVAPIKDRSSTKNGLRAKWDKFLDATVRAGTREEKLSLKQRLRDQVILYNVGQVRGVLKGLYEGVGSIVNSRSALNQLSPTRLHREIPKLGDKTLDWGIRYMDADWKSRGEMAGQEIIHKGLWIIQLRNIILAAKNLLTRTTKKLKL